MLSFAKALAHHIAQEQQQEDMLTQADTKAAQATTHMPAADVVCEPDSGREIMKFSARSRWFFERIGSALTANVHRLLDTAPARYGEALTDDDASVCATVPSLPDSLSAETIKRD